MTGHLVVDETGRLGGGTLDPVPGPGERERRGGRREREQAGDARLGQRHAPQARVLLGLTLLAPALYVGGALDGFWISIAWAVEAVLVVVTGFALRLKDLRLAAFALFALVLGRVFLFDLGRLDLGYRIVSFLVVGALLLGASFLYARARTGERGA